LPLLSVIFLDIDYPLFVLYYGSIVIPIKLPDVPATAFVLTDKNIASSSEKDTSVRIAFGIDKSIFLGTSPLTSVFAVNVLTTVDEPSCDSKEATNPSVSASYLRTASNVTATSGNALAII